MVRETPPFPRKARGLSDTIARPSRAQTAEAPGAPLPFLHHTNALFTPEEMVEVNLSIKKAQSGVAFARTPSRLQQIRSQHFKHPDAVGGVMALEIHPSDLYHLPTASPSKPQDRTEALISVRDDDFALGSARSSRSSFGGGLMMPLSEDITNSEMRSQVWVYIHETKGSGNRVKAAEYMGEIDLDVDVATPFVTRGRRRLLNAIRENSQSEAPMIWPRRQDPEVLTDRNYCAKRLHDFLDKRNIAQPEFLEKRITRDRPTIDRRRIRR
jgi:hypothetical protein